jgi:hypothetical protein
MLVLPRKRYPSTAVCENECDGFREGLNPSYGLTSNRQWGRHARRHAGYPRLYCFKQARRGWPGLGPAMTDIEPRGLAASPTM